MNCKLHDERYLFGALRIKMYKREHAQLHQVLKSNEANIKIFLNLFHLAFCHVYWSGTSGHYNTSSWYFMWYIFSYSNSCTIQMAIAKWSFKMGHVIKYVFIHQAIKSGQDFHWFKYWYHLKDETFKALPANVRWFKMPNSYRIDIFNKV